MYNRDLIYWQNYLNLENSFLEISKYIFISDSKKVNQMSVFSLKIADLLIQTAVEIESISVTLFKKFGLDKTLKDEYEFDKECLQEIDLITGICNNVVYVANPSFDLTKNEKIKPLENIYTKFTTNANDKDLCKRNEAYNNLKHNKYNSLKDGSIINTLYALGALYLLNIYLKDISVIGNKNAFTNFDTSFGSKIFALNMPNVTGNEQLNPNLEIGSEGSPFIIGYPRDFRNEIILAHKNGEEKIDDYIMNKNKILYEKYAKSNYFKRKTSSGFPNLDKLRPFCIFKINEQIPNYLEFDKRKELLLSSNEFNCDVSINNLKIKPNEIDKDNIQKIIDKVGGYYADFLWRNFEVDQTVKLFLNKVYELRLKIKNIKYEK